MSVERGTCNDQLYKEVSEILDVSPKLVKMIANQQSLSTIKRMGRFEGLRYVYIGSFIFNRGKFLKMNINE